MRYKLIILFGLLAAGTARAQLSFLSDSGTVSVYGSGASQNYSQTNTSPAPFTDFNGSATGNANDSFTSSSASQNTFATASQISFSGAINCDAPYGAGYGSEFNAYAGANAVFDVSFSVSAATAFSLTESDFDLQGFPGGMFTLSSANDGVILQGPPSFNFGFPTVNEYSGVLEPDDIYTLQVSSSLEVFASPSQMNAEDAAGISVVMAAPEPAPGLILGVGAGLLGLGAILRRRKNLRTSRLH